MSAATLVLDGAMALLIAGVYAFVGATLARRRVQGPAAAAWTLFVVWWYALAGMQLLAGASDLLAAGGWMTLPLALTFRHVTLLVVCVAVWGLLYYLVYLLSGRRRALAGITAFYAAYYVGALYVVTSAGAAALDVGRWDARVVPRDPIDGPVLVLLVAGLLGPSVTAGIGYFRLFFRVEDRTQRYRIGLLSGVIVVWFTATGVGILSGVSSTEWWHVLKRALDLGAALAILMAYHPPAWLRERYGLGPLDGAPPPAPRTPSS